MAEMYVWATEAEVAYGPFKHLKVAHAWVTDYLAPPCVPDAGGPLAGGGFPGYEPNSRYWACFSGPPYENGCRNSKHPGKPFKVYECTDLTKADTICCPNDPYAFGGLGAWGKAGTCQQLTNRILWPAKRDLFGVHRTCAGVTGWILSFLWFGPYGKTPWPPEGEAARGLPPDFQDFARARLIPESAAAVIGLQQDLLQQKAMLDSKIEGEIENRQAYADTINGLTADFLWDAKGQMSDDEFISLFEGPYEKGVIPSVLDPHH
jgi:hypothetical protein